MDTGELWVVRYDALLAECTRHPALLAALHEAMSREIARDRDSLMSVCTLPGRRARRRLPALLGRLARAARPAHRPDQAAHDTCGDRNYLGMTLETVSRALSRLARDNIIAFAEKGRRDVHIPDVDALAAFVQRVPRPGTALQ
jgi:CRP/FNR family transcriptional regulator